MRLFHPPKNGRLNLRASSLPLFFAIAAAVSIFVGCQTLPANSAQAATPVAARDKQPVKSGQDAAPVKARDKKSPKTPETTGLGQSRGNRISYHAFLSGLLAEIAGDNDRAFFYLERAHEADPDSFTISMELVRLSMERNEDGKTLARAIDLAAKHPENAEAHFLLGVARARNKEFEAAARSYKKSLEIEPGEKAVYVALMMLASQSEKMEIAEDILKSLAVRFPAEPLPRYSLGAIYAEKKEWDKAVAEYGRAAEADPEMAEPARREIIRVHQASGQTAKLIEVYKAMLAEDPADIEASAGLAEAYLAEKDLPKAKTVIDGIIKDSGGEAAIIRSAGRLYYGAGYPDEAMKLFTALAERPDSGPEDWTLAATVLEDMGKKEEAYKIYVRVPPDSRFYATARVNAASISKTAEDREKAYEAVKTASGKGGAETNLYISLAAVFEDAKNFARAEAILKKALTEHENEPHLMFRLGVLYDRWGKKDEAIKTLKQAVALMPDSPEALNYLGYTYADLGVNLADAKALIEKALEKKPGDGFITDSLGWVYFKMGDFNKALEILKKAVEIVPDEATILEHLGDAYLASGNAAKALETYEKALPKQEDQEVKKGLLKKIEELKKSGKTP
ncbi:MAG: tetratricopeptide repeat protein [Deltaproteobacteria bacterium]|nr:tetratricopeptide repeat protein [Deltaproteobacteria bacterium]